MAKKPKTKPVPVVHKPIPKVTAPKPVQKPAVVASPAVKTMPEEGSIDDLEAYVAKAQKLLQTKKAEAEKAA